ncbi:MAG: hypothetical protein J0L92_04750 [Deltaproteobacteria bacterium]|nr:hypothetical protein [Deltaproteobacteria bacterium]
MSARRWARVSLGAAGVVIALTVVSTFMRPVPCGDLDRHYPPIIAFELARSGADLDAIFGSDEAARTDATTEALARCRGVLVPAMDQIQWADLFLFMPAYGLFLIGFFASARVHSPRASSLGIGLVVVAVVFDGFEDASLLVLSHTRDASSLAAGALPFTTGVKWLSLGLAALPEAVILAAGGRLSKLGAAMSTLALPCVIAALLAPATLDRLAPAVAVAWIHCLVAVAVWSRTTPEEGALPRA